MATDEPVSVDCTKLHETDKAILFEVVTQGSGLVELWMPKSQIKVDGSAGKNDEVPVVAPEWLWVSKCKDMGAEMSGYKNGTAVIITPNGLE